MGFGPSGIWGQNWTSRESFFYHYGEHGEKFNRPLHYFNSAGNFVNGSSTNTQSFTAINGATYLWNSVTNQFAIVTRSGQIVTYYVANPGGWGYWEGLLIDNGIVF